MKNFKKLSLLLIMSISYNFCRETGESENTTPSSTGTVNGNTTTTTETVNTTINGTGTNTNYTINVSLSSIQKSANNDLNKLKKIKGLNNNQITQLNNIQNQIIVATNPQQIKMLVQNANQIVKSGVATKKALVKNTINSDKKFLNEVVKYDKNKFSKATSELLYGKTITVQTESELRELIKIGHKFGTNGLLFGNARLDQPSNSIACNEVLNALSDLSIKQFSKNYKFIIIYMDTSLPNAQNVAISLGIPDQGKNFNLWGVPYLVDVRTGNLPDLITPANASTANPVPVVSPLVVMAASKDIVMNHTDQLVSTINSACTNFVSINKMISTQNTLNKNIQNKSSKILSSLKKI